MSAPRTSAPGGWVVQAQNQTTKLGPNNRPVDGYDITFATSTGHTGTVFVTMAQYVNVDTVRELIAAAAAQVDAVGNLTSTS